MHTLEKRVGKLERQPWGQEPWLIVRRTITPGFLDTPDAWGEVEGERLDRLADEAAEEFIERLRVAAMDKSPGRQVYAVAVYGSET